MRDEVLSSGRPALDRTGRSAIPTCVFHTADIQQETRGRGTYDLTARVQDVVRASKLRVGLCTLFVHHTSASILVCENADVNVREDLERFFAKLVPDGDPLFEHVEEGPDDMPSHVRSILTQTSIGIPVRAGTLDLGVWQGLYLFEHRLAPHTRRLSVSIVGEP